MARAISERRREAARLRAIAWRKNNGERHRAYTRRYKRAHAAEQYAKNRQWAKDHPELVKEYHRKSRQKNPVAHKESHERYWAKNPDLRRLWCANRRARLRGVGGVITDSEWCQLAERYDHRCLRCGQLKPLTLDHVMPLSRGGPHTIENAQPLCLSCNSWKHTQHIDYRTSCGGSLPPLTILPPLTCGTRSAPAGPPA